jgi:thiosulfate reductase cytochrome b subunit
MKETTKRAILRTIHLVLAIPIIGYIYSPFDQIPNYAFPTRFIFLPAMVLSGLWMWKGHLVRQFVRGRPAQRDADA